jgi:hypothetical protein
VTSLKLSVFANQSETPHAVTYIFNGRLRWSPERRPPVRRGDADLIVFRKMV